MWQFLREVVRELRVVAWRARSIGRNTLVIVAALVVLAAVAVVAGVIGGRLVSALIG